MKRYLSNILMKPRKFSNLLKISKNNPTKKNLRRKRIIYLTSGYLIVHLMYVYRNRYIKLIYKDSEKNIEIIKSIKDLNSKYYLQTPFFFSRCFEILYGNYETRETIEYEREIIYTKNGENIAVDYSIPEKEKNNKKRNREIPLKENSKEILLKEKNKESSINKDILNKNKHIEISDKKNKQNEIKNKKILKKDNKKKLQQKKKENPVVIIIPGLSGNSNAAYIKAQANGLLKQGFTVVAFNPVGNAIPQITSHLFDYRQLIDELDLVVDFITKKFDNRNIYLVGFSMGSSYGAKYISSERGHKKIKGMVCISNPFDLVKASFNLSSVNNYVYSKYLTSQLIEKTIYNFETVTKFIEKHNIKDFCLESLKKSETIFDYDKHYTFNLIERKNKCTETFYKHFSCHDDIKNIQRPVLFIQSNNDPISKPEYLPQDVILEKDNLMGVITPRGAHVEYFVGLYAKRWYVDVAVDYLLHLENKDCFVNL